MYSTIRKLALKRIKAMKYQNQSISRSQQVINEDKLMNSILNDPQVGFKIDECKSGAKRVDWKYLKVD